MYKALGLIPSAAKKEQNKKIEKDEVNSGVKKHIEQGGVKVLSSGASVSVEREHVAFWAPGCAHKSRIYESRFVGFFKLKLY
jgi:hypothetical protein